MPCENLQIEGKWTSLVGEGKTKKDRDVKKFKVHA